VDQYWLLTWTTYGSRLPGDARGSMATVRSESGPRAREHLPFGAPGLAAASRQRMRGPPLVLTSAQAVTVLRELRTSAEIHGWELLAAAVMANHVHVVVGVPGDPDPADLLRVFKAYASRELNRRVRPVSGTWWTRSGSRRVLREEPDVIAAIRYVRAQRGALALAGEPPEVRFG